MFQTTKQYCCAMNLSAPVGEIFASKCHEMTLRHSSQELLAPGIRGNLPDTQQHDDGQDGWGQKAEGAEDVENQGKVVKATKDTPWSDGCDI